MNAPIEVKKFESHNPDRPYGLAVDGNRQEFRSEADREGYLAWLLQVHANNQARAAQSERLMAETTITRTDWHNLQPVTRQGTGDPLSALERFQRAAHR